MRRFELVEGTSSKFWQVSVSGGDVTTQWGRIGTDGQTKTKNLGDAAKAEAEMKKLITEKTKKGYGEVAASGAAPAGTAPVGTAAAAPTKAAAPTTPTATPTTTPAPARVAEPTSTGAAGPAGGSGQPQPPASPPTGGTPPWLADGDPVDLDDSFRNLAFPDRDHPRPLPEAQGWSEPIMPVHHGLVADLTTAPPALHDLTRAAVAVVSDSANLTRERALGVLVVCTTQRVARQALLLVADQFGVVEATRLLLESYRYGIRLGRGWKQPIELAIVDDPKPWTGTEALPLTHNEGQLRRLLAVANAEDHAAAVGLVREQWPNLIPYRQAGLALALPDQPDLTDELINAHAAERPGWLHWLQATASTPELAAVAARARTDDYHEFGTTTGLVNALVVARGTGAVPYLAPHADREQSGAALARLGTPEAIQALAGVAQNSKTTLATFRAAVKRWPAAAAAGLAETAAGDGRAATLARSTLSELVGAQPGLADLVTPWLPAPATQLLTAITGRANQVFDEADPAELPPVLASPPWLQKRAKEAVVQVEPLTIPPVEVWPDGVRPVVGEPYYRKPTPITDAAMAAEAICYLRFQSHTSGSVEAELAAVAAALPSGDVAAVAAAHAAWVAAVRARSRYSAEAVDAWTTLVHARPYLDGIRPGFALEVWNAIAGTVETDRTVPYAVTLHGADALPGLLKVVKRRPAEELATVAPIGAVELAPVMARAFHKLKTVREVAFSWLTTHPEHAAAGLIAPAIGPAGEARDNARAALQRLAAVEDGRFRTVILGVAARYDREDVVTAVEQMLDQDPNDRYPTKLPKLPTWWSPAMWTRPLLTSGKALPQSAVDHFGTMLMFPVVDGEVYPGVGQVIEACDRDSLAEFGWDLFAAWLAAGGPSKDAWAMTSLGLFGTDETARRITPYLRAWPGEAQHKRAVTGLAVLEGIGTDLALMQLNGIATKIKFKGLQDEARVKITAIAENRGLTTEELEDRLAPDLGLAADGTTTLDFGTRTFTVGFDEALRPYVRDADGARLKDLPKPRQTDDADLATAATNRWKTLKKDVRAVASQQVQRLEVAMCLQRRWPLATFETFLAGHPLVRHLVQRVLWATYDGDGRPALFFRVDEGGGCTDADDEPITLPTDAVVGIPHTLEIPAEVAAGFGQLFADYELLQPFDQLARESYQLSDAELAATKLTRWSGTQVPTGKILGLTNRGWRRGVPADGGVASYMEKQIGDVSIIATLDPGLFTGMLSESPEQDVTGVQVGTTDGWGYVKGEQAFSALTPIAISELVRDLDGLRD